MTACAAVVDPVIDSLTGREAVLVLIALDEADGFG